MTVLTLILAGLLLLDDEPPAPPLELSLQDALTLTVQNNLALQQAVLDADAAVDSFKAAWGDFDTVFFANATRFHQVVAPSPSSFVGGINVGASPTTKISLETFTTGFRGMLTTGTQWNLELTPRETRTSTTLTPTSRVDTAQWGIDLTQPLLRGGTNDYALSGVKLAAHDAGIASLATRTTADQTFQAVVTAYWNLVFARQDVDTRELSVDLAEELRDITQRKFDQGLQNRIDVIETEAELANREEELLTARNALDQAMDDLRTLVLAPEAQGDWSRELVPTSDFDEAEPFDVDTDTAIAVALENRPDVASARLSVERAEIELERAQDQALPRLDITGSYGTNSNEKRNLSNAVRALDDTDFYETRVFLDFEWSLGNRAAGYTVRRREVERERAGVDLRDTEMAAVAAVRTAARNVGLQLARVDATAETTRLRREVHEGEVRRLENDLSTPFQVRQAQRDLLEAIDVETRARLDLAVARTDLLAAQGRLSELLGYEPPGYDLSLDESPPAP